ncbi:hypothetical protein HMPREF9141_0706 [Prevotella multiformis DSM 16608]|uniref:Uncharacterized protein n=1 Tax=Prevotella multiformis DSM 16608 TaxID=888743 RepID=F0F540_9BACT|nr:hypothetical protein HMPREF9141_0706 [Prevotella multiformis DSM 16608]
MFRHTLFAYKAAKHPPVSFSCTAGHSLPGTGSEAVGLGTTGVRPQHGRCPSAVQPVTGIRTTAEAGKEGYFPASSYL